MNQSQLDILDNLAITDMQETIIKLKRSIQLFEKEISLRLSKKHNYIINTSEIPRSEESINNA